MPRRSAIARAMEEVAVPASTPAKLVPPADLTTEQARDWQALAARLPKSLPAADVVPLLTELARHMSFSRQLGEEIAKLRQAPLSDADTLAQIETLLKLHERQSLRITALMTKLRLSPQDREQPYQSDRRRQKPPASLPKPWEDEALDLIANDTLPALGRKN
jgi:hypothetical protein